MGSTRESYGKVLAEIGSDKNIVVLDADVSTSTKTAKFAEKYPDRFFNMGISEADMVSTAAGMAAEGKIAFASSFATFLTGRAYDQVRVSVAYSNMNVKLVATHAGLTVGEDGATHQMLEDVGLMRTLPNMSVYTASTPGITEKIIRKIYKEEGPTYVRLYRPELEDSYSNLDEDMLDAFIEIGIIPTLVKGKKFKEHDIILVTMGDMLPNALKVQKKLSELGLNILVLDAIKLKPFNSEYLLEVIDMVFKEKSNSLKKAPKIYTFEDHSIYGGLGSTVSEVLSEHKPMKIKRFGMTTFGESGEPLQLFYKFNLDPEYISRTIYADIQIDR